MYLQLAEALIAVFVTVLICRLIKGKQYEKKAVIVLLITALCGILYYTLVSGSRAQLGGMKFSFPPPFIKALMTLHYGLTTNRSVLNILLFVPFGLVLSTLFYDSNRFKIRWWIVMIVGLAVSLAVETSQLVFRLGVFEIDDLVKNTIGATLGYYLFYLLNKRDINSQRG